MTKTIFKTAISVPSKSQFIHMIWSAPNSNISENIFQILQYLPRAPFRERSKQNLVMHRSGNNHLELTTNYSPLEVSQKSPMVVSINTNLIFDIPRYKICFPIMEVLLWATASNLVGSKNPYNWVTLNAVPLPPFLAKAAIRDRQASTLDLIKLFVVNV